MLEILSVNYKINSQLQLHNITATLKPGSFSMIIGPNGSGKSTLMKIISGDLKADKGSVKYGDRIVEKKSLKEIAKIRATMSQHSLLTFPMTVEEIVIMGRYPHFQSRPSAKDIEICTAALRKLSIEHLKERNYLTLSGGERQRVFFAKSLAQIWDEDISSIKYLLLDEPIASLDPNYQHEFLNIAKELAMSDNIVVAVIHDINLASQYGDYFIALKNGEILSKGSRSEVMNSSLLSELYQISFVELATDSTSYPVFITQK